MKIELLYFNGCPSWQRGLENLKSALQLEGIETNVNLVNVRDDADAVRFDERARNRQADAASASRTS